MPQILEPGNAIAFGPEDIDELSGLSVAIPRSQVGQLVGEIALSTSVLTPNGDGVNDLVRVEYEVLNLRGGTPLAVTIYDLAGRRIAALDAGQVNNGRGHVDWDGTGSDGLPVPPGIYVVEGGLQTDAGDESASRAVAVVY